MLTMMLQISFFVLFVFVSTLTFSEDAWEKEQYKWFDYQFDSIHDIPHLNLQNGQEIPQLGFGTYLASGDELVEALKFGLRLGYRHIDTAISYNNHIDIARAIGSLGVSRSSLFITSKIPPHNFGYNETLMAIDQIRNELDIKSIDLCLIHKPITLLNDSISIDENMIYLQSKLRKETWLALEYAKENGICTSIGVSNYDIQHLKELKMYSNINPSVNQIELHPYYIRTKLIQYCNSNHIIIAAYGSIVPRGDKSLLNEPILDELSVKYSKTKGQILLRWAVQQGFVVIPKSFNKHHIAQNSKIFDFEMDYNDITKINQLNKNTPYFADYSYVPTYDWKNHQRKERMKQRQSAMHDEL